MRTYIILILFILNLSNQIFGQDTWQQYRDVGIEIQQYPTGFIPGLKAEFGLKPHHAIDFRIGYVNLDREDFGVHDSEIGDGFGATIGYRYYFNPSNTKLFLGARSDLLFLNIDWQDIEDQDILEGETSVVVLQPTAIIGYSFLFSDHFILSPTLALGAEINVKTDGEPVGQGAIFLWGLNFLYRF